jgi:hypothetical protein
LKPLASPELRFGEFEGGVAFGESDMVRGKKSQSSDLQLVKFRCAVRSRSPDDSPRG